MWQLLLLHAVFASTYTLGKAALSYVEPVLFVAARMTLGSVVLLGYLFISGRSFRIKHRDRILFILLGFFLFYSWVPDFAVLPYVATTKWALIYALTPFCTALIGYFRRSEPVTWLKMIGLFIGLVGILPVLAVGADLKSMTFCWNISWPDIVMLVCMVGYSYGWTIAQKLIKTKKYEAILVNGVGMLIGGLGALVTSPFIDNWSHSPISDMWPFLGILFAIVVTTVLAFTINTYFLRYYTVTFLMFLMFVDPIYVAIYGRIFLNEPIQWHFFLSIVLVFFGLYLFYKEELKHGYLVSS